MAVCGIAIGGNTGDVLDTFNRAFENLDRSGVHLRERSSNFTSQPMGANAGNAFFNGVAVCETELTPHETLDVLLKTELLLGRTRSIRWGPRRIDLDLLFHGDSVIADDRLILPHPGIWYRGFVAAPLAEIRPQWIHPTLRRSAANQLQALIDRPLRIEIHSTENPLPDLSIVQAAIDSVVSGVTVAAPSLAIDEHITDGFAQIEVTGYPHRYETGDLSRRVVWVSRHPEAVDFPGVPQGIIDFCTAMLIPKPIID